MNKNSIDNPHEEEYNFFNKTAKNLIDKKSSALLKDKPFCEEYKAVYLLLSSLSFILGVSLAIGSFFALHYVLTPVIGSSGVIVASILCLGIEGVKLESGKVSLKSYYKYRSLKTLPTALYLLATLFSIGLSVYGVYGFACNYDYKNEIEVMKPKMLDNSKYIADKTQEIDSLNEVAKDFKSQILATSSNSTKRGLNKSLLLVMNEANTIKERLHKDNDEVKSINKAREAKYEGEKVAAQNEAKAKNQKAAFSYCVLAFVFEIILFLCYNFNFYYYFRNEVHNTNGFGLVDIEQAIESPIKTVYVNSDDNKNGNDLQQITQTATATRPAEEKRNKIGFGGSKRTENVKDEPIRTPKCNGASQVPNGTCSNPKCGKTFKRKSVLRKYCSDKCKGEAYRIRNKK